MTVQTQGPVESPPLEPTQERAIEGHPEFTAECKARSQYNPAGEWEWGEQLLTQSDQWGLVWRADFKTPSTSDKYVNRVVCWIKPDGTLQIHWAVAHDIPPLRRP